MPNRGARPLGALAALRRRSCAATGVDGQQRASSGGTAGSAEGRRAVAIIARQRLTAAHPAARQPRSRLVARLPGGGGPAGMPAGMALAGLALALMVAPLEAATKKSVLMFAVDDLRTQLSIYPEGGEVMHTPNFERIAKQSVVFERAYVMVALCMPSRTSLLTGRRPDTSRSWTIETDQWFRNSGGNWTTLPGRFKAEGYLTLGMGKIFHEGMPSWDPQDAHVSWSPEAVFGGAGLKGKGGLYDPSGIGKEGGGDALAKRVPDDEEPTMQDGNITNHAVATIEKMASGGFGADVASGKRPFFLAVGFHKPVSSTRLCAPALQPQPWKTLTFTALILAAARPVVRAGPVLGPLPTGQGAARAAPGARDGKRQRRDAGLAGTRLLQLT